MKISDLHKAFKVLMDKNSEAVAFGGCPAFLPEEIDLFLNQAYIEVICNKYTGNNTMQVGFEGAVKRIADLQKLIKTDSAQNLVYPYASSNVLTLSLKTEKSLRECSMQIVYSIMIMKYQLVY